MDARWCFPRLFVTASLTEVSRADLTADAVEQAFLACRAFTNAIAARPDVVGWCVKLEVAQGKGGRLLFHLHALLMVTPGFNASSLAGMLPPSERTPVVGPAGGRAARYLAKPYIKNAKMNPVTRQRLCRALTAWQGRSGLRRFFWTGGLYVGYVERWARTAVEWLAELADAPAGIAGLRRRLEVRPKVQRSTAVAKWRGCLPFYVRPTS